MTRIKTSKKKTKHENLVTYAFFSLKHHEYSVDITYSYNSKNKSSHTNIKFNHDCEFVSLSDMYNDKSLILKKTDNHIMTIT